jgi:hypothetical protein
LHPLGRMILATERTGKQVVVDAPAAGNTTGRRNSLFSGVRHICG